MRILQCTCVCTAGKTRRPIRILWLSSIVGISCFIYLLFPFLFVSFSFRSMHIVCLLWIFPASPVYSTPSIGPFILSYSLFHTPGAIVTLKPACYVFFFFYSFLVVSSACTMLFLWHLVPTELVIRIGGKFTFSSLLYCSLQLPYRDCLPLCYTLRLLSIARRKFLFAYRSLFILANRI